MSNKQLNHCGCIVCSQHFTNTHFRERCAVSFPFTFSSQMHLCYFSYCHNGIPTKNLFIYLTTLFLHFVANLISTFVEKKGKFLRRINETIWKNWAIDCWIIFTRSDFLALNFLKHFLLFLRLISMPFLSSFFFLQTLSLLSFKLMAFSNNCYMHTWI